MEWGTPLHGDDALFERLSLEAFQSGLSWITILRKREAFRAAFAGFVIEKVALFTEDDETRLMADAGIVRNRAKVEAAIANARALLALQAQGGSLAGLLWATRPEPDPPPPRAAADVPPWTPASRELARELKRRGFRFLGPTTVYAALQACGIVNDHLAGCPARPVVEALR